MSLWLETIFATSIYIAIVGYTALAKYKKYRKEVSILAVKGFHSLTGASNNFNGSRLQRSVKVRVKVTLCQRLPRLLTYFAVPYKFSISLTYGFAFRHIYYLITNHVFIIILREFFSIEKN